MSILNVLHFPHPGLKRKAERIETVDDIIKILASDMLATMYEANGVGLAATQVNIQKQIFVMDVSDKQDTPLVFINPNITAQSSETVVHEEGCLSFPGIYVPVKRAKEITVEYLDREGNQQIKTCSGLEAVCIQHETKHLMGKTIYDELSWIKQRWLEKQMEKNRKKTL